MAVIRNGNTLIEGDPVVLAPAAARTTAGSGPTAAVGEHHTARLSLAVTAASGTTPSLAVSIEHSEDGSTWTTHSTFAAATTAGAQRKVISGLDRFLRATWLPTGASASFSFTLTGELI